MYCLKSAGRASLTGIPPAALAALALSLGWEKGVSYRRTSHVYSGPGLPDIIIPWTREIDDYAMVTRDLIRAFAVHSGREECEVYGGLAAAGRDEAAPDFVGGDDGPDFRVTGLICRLVREGPDGPGVVGMRIVADGRERLVTVVLEGADYVRAAGAHPANRPVTVAGDPERGPAGWRLRNARLL